uniref:Uncharacterized protein n=1 Tax=Anguilla anguilla TaxID=7936 RepID=A0A0E9R800_ANGAN
MHCLVLLCRHQNIEHRFEGFCLTLQQSIFQCTSQSECII